MHFPARASAGKEVGTTDPAESRQQLEQQGESASARHDARRESVAQRADRNLSEVIQELRVVSLGIQVLFGFLLSLPFTNRFGSVTSAQRGMYLTAVVLCAVSTALLIGPVAYHRLVFRRNLKDDLVRFANLMAILGLAGVAGAVLVTVLLVIDVVAGVVPAAIITSLVAVMIAGLWFAVPLARRRGAPGEDDDGGRGAPAGRDARSP